MKRVFWYNGKENVTQLAETLRQVAGENTVYVCLGSDKILIESIGPKVGTRIKARSNGSIIVYGIEGDPHKRPQCTKGTTINKIRTSQK